MEVQIKARLGKCEMKLDTEFELKLEEMALEREKGKNPGNPNGEKDGRRNLVKK